MMRASVLLLGSMLGVAGAQASEWSGSSLSLRSSANGVHCTAGSVRLSIDGETVHGSANGGTTLTGRLAANGSLSLSGGKGVRQVSFSGKKTGNRIRGSWVEALSGCGGTWRAEMTAAEAPKETAPPPPGSDDASIFMLEPDEIEPAEPNGDPQIPSKTDRD